MKKRQIEELRVVRYFAPEIERTPMLEQYFKLWYPDVVESVDGISPESAYFLYTSAGKKKFSVADLSEFHLLVLGQRMRDMQVKMWKDGVEEISYNELIGDVPNFVLKYLQKNL